MSGEITSQLISTPEELRRLAPEWNELCEISRRPRLMRSPVWLLPWWEVFHTGRTLQVISVRRGASLIGVAPFINRLHQYGPGFQYKRLEFMGSGEDEQDEIATDYLGVVALSGEERQVAEAVVEKAYSDDMLEWDELVCERMTASDAATSAFIHELHSQEGKLSVEVDDTTYYIPLPATFDAYLEALSSSRRYRLKRALKDFEKWSGSTPELLWVEKMEDVERGMDVVESLHAERWKDAGENGVFSSEKFQAFHRVLAKELFIQGMLQLCWIEVKGEPVVALYSFVGDRSVYFYQSGRKMDVPKRVQLGTVAHILAIQQAIKDGHREYDFLAGDARYKEEMALATRNLICVRKARSVAVKDFSMDLGRQTLRTVRTLRDAISEKITGSAAGKLSGNFSKRKLS